jgi:hypothetical protein
MASEAIQGIREYEQAATGGPWWNETHVVHAKHPTQWTHENHKCIHPLVAQWSFEDEAWGLAEATANADFTANARTDLPLLLAVAQRVVFESENHSDSCLLCSRLHEEGHRHDCPIGQLQANWSGHTQRAEEAE